MEDGRGRQSHELEDMEDHMGRKISRCKLCGLQRVTSQKWELVWKTPCPGLREGAFAQGLGGVGEGKTNSSIARNRRRREELTKAWAKNPPGNHALSWDGDAQSTVNCSKCSTRWLYAYGKVWQDGVKRPCEGERKKKELEEKRKLTAEEVSAWSKEHPDQHDLFLNLELDLVECRKCKQRSSLHFWRSQKLGLIQKPCETVEEGMSARLVAIEKKKGVIEKVTGSGAVKKTIKEMVEERRVATEAKRQAKLKEKEKNGASAAKQTLGAAAVPSTRSKEEERDPKKRGVANLSAGEEAAEQVLGKKRNQIVLRKASAGAKDELRKKKEEKRRVKHEAEKADEEEVEKISRAAGSKRRHTGSSKLEKSRKGAGAPRKPCGRSAPPGAPK